MNKRTTIVTVVVVMALIVGGALLAVAWPSLTGLLSGSEGGVEGGGVSISSATPSTIDVSSFTQSINGALGTEIALTELNVWGAFVVMAVVFTGAIVVTGLLLAVVYKLIDRSVSKTKEADSFKEAKAELTNREKAYIAKYKEEQPPDPVPSHERTRWSVISSVMIIIMFFVFGGLALGYNVSPDSVDIVLWGGIAGVIGLIVGLVFITPSRLVAADKNETQPISWGTIWLVLSGVIIVGLGLGLMLYVRSL